MPFLPAQLQYNILLSATEEETRRKNNRRQHNMQLFSHERKCVLGIQDGREMVMKYFYLEFVSSLKGKKNNKDNFFISPETNLPSEQLRFQIFGIWQQTAWRP